MHEASLARDLLRQIESLLLDAGGEAVEKVRLEVGPLSGVEPVLFEMAFIEQSAQSRITGAQLIIHEVPLEADCLDCHLEFEIRGFRFRCSACGSSRLHITRGDALILQSVDIRFADQQEESLP